MPGGGRRIRRLCCIKSRRRPDVYALPWAPDANLDRESEKEGRMLRRVLPALAAAMLAGGCASLVDGRNQSILVLTPDCPGAACQLHNDAGVIGAAALGSSI